MKQDQMILEGQQATFQEVGSLQPKGVLEEAALEREGDRLRKRRIGSRDGSRSHKGLGIESSQVKNLGIKPQVYSP